MSSPFIRTPAEQMLHDVHNNAESAHAAGGIPEGYDLQGNQLNGTNPNMHAPYGTELGHDASLPENYRSPSTRNAGVVAFADAIVRQVVSLVPGVNIQKNMKGWHAREARETAKVTKSNNPAWYEAPANLWRVAADMTELRRGTDEHGNELPERRGIRKVAAMIGGIAVTAAAVVATPLLALTYPARIIHNAAGGTATETMNANFGKHEARRGDSIPERAGKALARAGKRMGRVAVRSLLPVRPKPPVR